MTSDEEGVGAHDLATLGRADISEQQLEHAYRKTADRVGPLLAADAVMAVASLPGVRNFTAYLGSLSENDLRALAEQRQHDRKCPSDPARPTRQKCGDPRCGPNRRLEDPDTGADRGPCPTCHPSAQRGRGAISGRDRDDIPLM